MTLFPDLPEDGPAPCAATLSYLRERAMALRAAGPLDLYKACAVLTLKGGGSFRDYADALIRTLEQALGHPPKMLPPDAARTSFDEDWLLRLLERSRARDAASVAFMICSRVPPENRESVVFLVDGLADRAGSYAEG